METFEEIFKRLRKALVAILMDTLQTVRNTKRRVFFFDGIGFYAERDKYLFQMQRMINR
jgi:hypothetical protein